MTRSAVISNPDARSAITRVLVRDAEGYTTVSHALASLVRMAPSAALQPPWTAAHRVVDLRRAKMDARYHQRLRPTMGLSEADLT